MLLLSSTFHLTCCQINSLTKQLCTHAFIKQNAARYLVWKEYFCRHKFWNILCSSRGGTPVYECNADRNRIAGVSFTGKKSLFWCGWKVERWRVRRWAVFPSGLCQCRHRHLCGGRAVQLTDQPDKAESERALWKARGFVSEKNERREQKSEIARPVRHLH